ncbi:MAG: hypothetical protein E7570_00920 [Ruminococcaceae bacterium]|nr:hypothetical protein [Oscillospiraceae bacterium]
MKKNRSNKKKINNWIKNDATKWICILVVLLVIYMILDCENIPSRFVGGFSHINENIFGVVVNALTVIVLYIISYFAIEKRQQEKADETEKREQEAEKRELVKQENINKIVDLLILNTYNDCLARLKALSTPHVIDTVIVPKIDRNKPMEENRIMQIYLHQPFSSYEQIMQFAENGYISIKQLKEYLWVQNKYQHIVQDKIVMFDIDKIKGLEKLKDNSEAEFASLYRFLENAVSNKKK